MLLKKSLDNLLLAQYNIRIEIKKEARKADSVIKMKYATDYQERKLFGGRRANFDSLAPQPLSESLALVNPLLRDSGYLARVGKLLIFISAKTHF